MCMYVCVGGACIYVCTSVCMCLCLLVYLPTCVLPVCVSSEKSNP